MLRSDIYTRFLHTLKTLRDINFRDKISARTLNDRPFLPSLSLGILILIEPGREGLESPEREAIVEPVIRSKAYSLWVQLPAVDVSQGLNVV